MAKNQPFVCVNDAQWQLIEKALSKVAFPKVRGASGADLRKVWNSILYVLIRGCQRDEAAWRK